MAYRWKPKNAEVDADAPRAFGQCDRCGMVWNLDQLTWQYAYQGSMTPQNTRFLVCPKHLDPLNILDAPLILPPDPLPVFNARQGVYTIDEESFLATQDDETITTEDDDPITTNVPNPAEVAATAHLEAIFAASGASVATAYLDIFNGNPLGSGTSVLASITGSATRTNIASSLTTILGVAKNAAQIIVAAESAATVNISYLAFYNAASGGSLALSGPLNVRGPTVTEGNPVVFDPLGIQINLN